MNQAIILNYFYRKNASIPKETMETFLKFYRSLQVMHHVANDLVSFILPTIIPAAEALIIAAAYNTIRLYRKTDFVLTLTFSLLGLITLLILSLAVKCAVNVTEASKEFIENGQKWNLQNDKFARLSQVLSEINLEYWRALHAEFRQSASNCGSNTNQHFY